MQLFPHESVRPVQKDFMEKVKEALENGQHLIAHAPTGLGKTAAALSPALEYALKNNLTLFFLTSRHTQHMSAVETIEKMRAKSNQGICCIDIIGKKHMCGQNGVKALTSSEFSDYCRAVREKGECEFLSNVRRESRLSLEAELVAKEFTGKAAHVEDFIRRCKKERLCPFEIACIVGRKANAVIADYNHVLHPGIREVLFKKTGKQLSNSILIMDEAHNLPSRARKLLTFSLSSYAVEQAIKEAKAVKADGTAAHLNLLLKMLESLGECIGYSRNESLIKKQELFSKVEEITNYEMLSRALHSIADEILETKKRSFSASIANFLDAWTGPDNGFTRIISRGLTKLGRPFIAVSYKCLDPSIPLKEIASSARNVIAMSGTLVPTEMYKDLLGFEKAVCAEYESPFPKENRLNLIVPQTSTKFTARSAYMYASIAGKCAEIANAIPGNSVIFFPSYRIMGEVYASFQNLCSRTIFIEQPELGKDEKAEMLDSFKSYRSVGAVLLAVSAGSFGEGIDLMGDFLKGVVIVGLPLTRPDLETEELIRYYDLRYGKGWDYGYIMPAIITAMQNAGRCIRSETDRGVIVFLDERYIWPGYRRCFQKDWNMQISLNPKQHIERFFKAG